MQFIDKTIPKEYKIKMIYDKFGKDDSTGETCTCGECLVRVEILKNMEIVERLIEWNKIMNDGMWAELIKLEYVQEKLKKILGVKT